MRILHAGCGSNVLPAEMCGHEEFRLDIDPATNPDAVASITDMGEIGLFRSAYCCHALEHLYPHEVPIALGEFYRVLEPGGSLLLFVPDLEGLTPSDAVLYESPAGPITSWDLFYGMRSAIVAQPHMAHRTGFTAETLRLAILRAGFAKVTAQRLFGYNLMALAEKGKS